MPTCPISPSARSATKVPTAPSGFRHLGKSLTFAVEDSGDQNSLLHFNDSHVSTTVIGFSKPDRLDRILTGLSAELPSELFARLEELLPGQAN